MHGMWSGTLSFGLVSVPVVLFPALRRRPVQLRMLAADGTPLKRQYVCSADGKPVEGDRLVRGYPVEDGTYVVIEDQELEALEPEKTRDINLLHFVDVQSIDPFFCERPYFLAPSGSAKAYRLLAKVMEEQGKAGIATFVMWEKEYLVAIIAERGLLMAETLRFADELRTPEQVGLKATPVADAKLVKAFAASISSLSRGRISREELEDRYARRFKSLVDHKRKTRSAVVRTEVEENELPDNVVDLVAIFKERMARAR